MLYELLSSVFLATAVFGGALADSSRLIATPYGRVPADCVHVAEESHASLKSVKGGVWAHYPSGRSVFHPELPHCVKHMRNLKKARTQASGLTILTEWEDYASATMPDTMGVFSGVYGVPTESPDPTGGELLYFFIGMQDDGQPDLTIIQPVVSFCAESSRCDAGEKNLLPLGWSMMATNCCPSGQTWYGQVQALTTDSIVKASCASNSSVVFITMMDTATGNTSSLSQPDTQRRFNWAAVTLEQYYADTCTDYNSSPFNFNNMVLTTLNGATVTPTWKTITGSVCGAKVMVTDPFNVAIYGSTSREEQK